MTDMSLPIKAAVIHHITSDTVVTDLVAGNRIFSMQPPTKPALPFIRYGTPIISPYADTCGSGSEVGVTLDVFSSDENEIQRIAAALVESLKVVEAPFRIVSCDWDRTQFFQLDQDTWQGMVQFTLVATA